MVLVLERLRRTTYHDRRGYVWATRFGQDGYHRPFQPGASGESLNRMLVTDESALDAALSEEDETLEVSEPVVNEAHHFAGELQIYVRPRPGLVRWMRRRAGSRGQDLSWIASESGDPANDLFEVPDPNRMPSALVGERQEDPAQPGEQPFLGVQQHVLGSDRDGDLERPGDHSPVQLVNLLFLHPSSPTAPPDHRRQR